MVVVASALGVQTSDLLDAPPALEPGPVSRAADQPVFETPEGASRRVLKRDRARGIEIALSEYPPGAASATEPRGHEGYEFGIAIAGSIEVTIEGRTHALGEGDVISYPSSQPHRIANPGRRRARALWINLRNA
jgi:quercetin dioxygenase-like cupin family protein